MRKPLERPEPDEGAAAPAAVELQPPKHGVADGEQRRRAHQHDCAVPVQDDLVEEVPTPPGRLYQHIRSLRRDVDPSLDAWLTPQQHALLHLVRIRRESAIWGEALRTGRGS